MNNQQLESDHKISLCFLQSSFDDSTTTHAMISSMIRLAIAGLEYMYDEKEQLFCYKTIRSENGIFKEGFSYRYTLISALGLVRYGKKGGISTIPVKKIVSTLLNKSNKIDSIGDLGLLLWLCALATPERLPQVYSDLKVNDALQFYPDARKGFTTELSWFLAGLVHATKANIDAPDEWKALAEFTFKRILRNYKGKGIFGHMHRKSIKGFMRGHIGSFADQVYPIYAFSVFAETFNNEQALNTALECGKCICRHQGIKGQWWWHYNSISGKIAGRYPVYSVHQDSMAALALFQLGKSSGMDIRQPVFKGLEWIFGNNEPGYNMIDTSYNLIWRCIYQKKIKMYYDNVLHLLGIPKAETNIGNFKVIFECWPDHLGWVLYAFAK